MAFDIADAFNNADEQAAYEAFVAKQERGLEGFQLDAPALVCRWRMAGKRVPLLNRHIRALSQRHVNGTPLSHNLLSWAKQHIEWSVAEGDFATRNGVLMLVVDVEGNAAMSVGEYESLSDTSADSLFGRAADAVCEAAKTGVPPEVLCCVEDNKLVVHLAPELSSCGVLTLVEQLATTRGLTIERNPDADVRLATGTVFLVSDEHGIVPAEGTPTHSFVTLCQMGYAKLFKA